MLLRGTRLRDQTLTPDIRAAMTPLLRLLSRRDAPLAAIALGVALCLPALLTGFSLADYGLRLHANGDEALPVERPSYDLFAWLAQGEAEHEAIVDRTGLWSLPADADIRAPRPLTSLLHAIEQAGWPEQAWAMHLQNLFWYAVLLAALAALYRDMLGAGWIAAAALLLYAVDDARGPAVASITGRHQLIAAACATAALLAHHRWRATAWGPGAWIGPLAFALGLAFSETAIATLAYVLAYVIVLERAPGPQQWATFAAYALVAGAWCICMGVLGYSVTDPFVQPLQNLGSFVLRLPLLALAQTGIPFAASWLTIPAPWLALLATAAAALVAIAGWVVLPLLDRNPQAAFWGLGFVLALVPASLGSAGDAALVFPGIGFVALAAQFFAAVLHTARDGRLATLRAPVVALAVSWFALHAVLSPLLLPLRAFAPYLQHERSDAIAASLPSDPALAEQQLVIVNAPSLDAGPEILTMRAATGGRLPESARVLAVGSGPVRVTRVAEDRVELRLARGMAPVPLGPLAPLVGAANRRFADEGSVEIDGFRARIGATEAGLARRLEFAFDVPCDNESLRWVAWDGEGFEPFVVPSVGEHALVGKQ